MTNILLAEGPVGNDLQIGRQQQSLNAGTIQEHATGNGGQLLTGRHIHILHSRAAFECGADLSLHCYTFKSDILCTSNQFCQLCGQCDTLQADTILECILAQMLQLTTLCKGNCCQSLQVAECIIIEVRHCRRNDQLGQNRGATAVQHICANNGQAFLHDESLDVRAVVEDLIIQLSKRGRENDLRQVIASIECA